MPVTLVQQGSAGALRDMDYINPRPKKASSALPPEVRRRLGLDRCVSVPSFDAEEHSNIYTGAVNAAPKVAQSGAGTNWQNPNGHAFVRRGSGIPMSQRASRKAQLAAAGADILGNGPSSGASAAGGSRPNSRQDLPPILPPVRRNASKEAAADSDAPRAPSRERSMLVGGRSCRPSKAALRPKSLPPLP
mmetsp:Transcript_21698/g.38133  ORF Transcript_21698/g.38133 Transcript_21698/m.38133 type:complete len:190 (+) Transcript_21698:147-716(+)